MVSVLSIDFESKLSVIVYLILVMFRVFDVTRECVKPLVVYTITSLPMPLSTFSIQPLSKFNRTHTIIIRNCSIVKIINPDIIPLNPFNNFVSVSAYKYSIIINSIHYNMHSIIYITTKLINPPNILPQFIILKTNYSIRFT